MEQFIQRKYIISAIVIILLACLGWVIYSTVTFRLTSTSPESNNFATSTLSVEFNFSQPVKSIGTITISSGTIDHYTIDGKKITVSLTDTLQENTAYSIKLKNIDSKWFDKTISAYTFSFTPTYIDFNGLSSEQQKASIDRSNSGQINDPFLNNTFPIITDDYKIEAENAGDGKTIYVYVTFLKEIPDYDNGGKVTQLSDSEAKTLQNKALKTITDNGGSPNKYKIIYSNDYLNAQVIK